MLFGKVAFRAVTLTPLRGTVAALTMGIGLFYPFVGTACDTSSARMVFEMLADPHMTTSRRVENGKLIYQWGPDFSSWNESTQLQLATTAANADACLTGQSREIEFYSPYGHLVAKATPGGGVFLAK